MNPFLEKPLELSGFFSNWKQCCPEPYDKDQVDPHTRARVILMNSAEFEAIAFSHQLARHCTNEALRREVSIARGLEQQQQGVLCQLTPQNETVLQHTIAHEQLAVELTAVLAQREPDARVKMALNFALLEDLDHLYRFANLACFETGLKAERLVGDYTEIMPGRPTISQHRWPADNVLQAVEYATASPVTWLNIAIVTAVAQQTMNYYMNVQGFYGSDLGRRLYQEIARVEEQHVSHYESLLDPRLTWLENLLLHEYTECYLYYSCLCDETNGDIKRIWEYHYLQEVAQLHMAAHLLEKYEGKHWRQVIPQGEFPELLRLTPSKAYVRRVEKALAPLTEKHGSYPAAQGLPQEDAFCRFQRAVNQPAKQVPSHEVICKTIAKVGLDYRCEEAPHPLEPLRNRQRDNTTLGRCGHCGEASI